MAQDRVDRSDTPEVKRLDECEAEFQTFIDHRRGKSVDPEVYDAAVKLVSAAVRNAAACILRGQPDLVENAELLWWRDMQKEGGCFDRYDSGRPFGPYAFKTLKWNCRGRENQRDQHGRRSTTRNPDDDRRHPDKDASPTQGIDRRQVPLEFDPVDHRSTKVDWRRQRIIDDVRAALKTLPERERKALLFQQGENEQYAELASDFGISKAAVTSLLHRARTALHAKLEELGYRQVFTVKGFSFTPP